MSCASCGAANRADHKFCAECGAALAVACASCGAANEPENVRELQSSYFAEQLGWTRLLARIERLAPQPHEQVVAR